CFPKEQLEGRGHPAMGADIEDASRPAQRRQQQQRVPEKCRPIAPIEARRIEHHHESGEADRHAERAPSRDRLLEEEAGAGRYPERGRIAEHDGASRRDELQPDAHQRREADHVEEADTEDDRHVAAARQDEASLACADGQQHERADRRAKGGGPERRQAFKDDLGDRPTAAPGKDHRCQKKNGIAAREVMVCHGEPRRRGDCEDGASGGWQIPVSCNSSRSAKMLSPGEKEPLMPSRSAPWRAPALSLDRAAPRMCRVAACAMAALLVVAAAASPLARAADSVRLFSELAKPVLLPYELSWGEARATGATSLVLSDVVVTPAPSDARLGVAPVRIARVTIEDIDFDGLRRGDAPSRLSARLEGITVRGAPAVLPALGPGPYRANATIEYHVRAHAELRIDHFSLDLLGLASLQ